MPLVLMYLLSACGGDSDSISGKDIGGGQTPPFYGTIFIAPDLIKDSDPTSYAGLTYTGQDVRSMYDRRGDTTKEYNAHLFVATFDDGIKMEIQVNPEFEQTSAMNQAEKYSRVIGQLPFTLRKHIKFVFMHDGNYDWSGDRIGSEGVYDSSGDANFSDGWLLIHTQRGEEYIAEGILAETLIHEAVHAVFEKFHAENVQWKLAQQQDIGFISTYAQQHHTREDLAESFVTYLAVRYKPDRISEELHQIISETIAHRINYFDTLNVEIYPMVMSSK
ncbi:MAG: hypothetical protein HRT53_10750 [Colwellia sp.]|nr:hypothetical protein [Colwellia sp.]